MANHSKDVQNARVEKRLPEAPALLANEALVETSVSLRPEPMGFFGQLFTYLVGGSFLVVICFIGALITAFAGSSHNPPWWYIPLLGVTQALPILLFFISSWSLLHSIANNIPFRFLSRIWIGSLAVYFGTWGVFFVIALGAEMLGHK